MCDRLVPPNGIRTRVAAVKGRCPRPLDDGGLLAVELASEDRIYLRQTSVNNVKNEKSVMHNTLLKNIVIVQNSQDFISYPAYP